MLSLKYLINMVYEPYRAALKRMQAPFDRAAHWRKTAKVLKLSKNACLRLEWMIYCRFTAHGNISLTARHFGISRKVFYTWLNRFDESNLRTLEDLSKAPNHTRQKEITPREEDRILKLRKAHIRWGKMKLHNLTKSLPSGWLNLSLSGHTKLWDTIPPGNFTKKPIKCYRCPRLVQALDKAVGFAKTKVMSENSSLQLNNS